LGGIWIADCVTKLRLRTKGQDRNHLVNYAESSICSREKNSAFLKSFARWEDIHVYSFFLYHQVTYPKRLLEILDLTNYLDPGKLIYQLCFALVFFLTPLGHTEQHLPKKKTSQ
jgi:hypothetical protein